MKNKDGPSNAVGKITNVEFIPVKFQKGLLGFASFTWDNSIYLSSIGVKVKPDGSLYLLCPSRKFQDKNLQYFYPINSETYESMIDAVLPLVYNFINCESDKEEENNE